MFKIKPLYYYLAGIVIVAIICVVTKLIVAPAKNSPFVASPLPLPSGIVNQSSTLVFEGNIAPSETETSMVLYKITPSDINSIKNRLTQSFLLPNPQLVTFPNGQSKYTWKSEGVELNYYSDQQSISYLNSHTLNPSAEITSALYDQAVEFINTHLPLPSSVGFSLVKTTYLQSNGSVGKEVSLAKNANLVQYEFRYTLNNKRLYFGTSGAPDLIVLLNNQGIRNVKAKILPSIEKLNKQRLISFNGNIIQQQISDGNYAVVRVDNQQYSETGPQFNVASIKIRSIETGYSLGLNQVTPVYVIRGTATNAAGSSTVYNVEAIVNIEIP